LAAAGSGPAGQPNFYIRGTIVANENSTISASLAPISPSSAPGQSLAIDLASGRVLTMSGSLLNSIVVNPGDTNGLIKNGAGTLSLTTNSTKSNTLGTLQLNGATLTTNNGVNGTCQVGSLTDTVTGGGSTQSTTSTTGTNPGIHLGSSTNNIITFNAAPDLIVNAVLQDNNIAGANSITKTGAGTLELRAASTYSGTTTVSSRTLLVNNSTGSATGTSAVVVSGPGTTLGGAGRIAPGSNGLSILSGASLAPANSPDALSGSFDNTSSAPGYAALFGGTPPHLASIDRQAFALFYNANSLTSSLSGGNALLLIAIPEPTLPLLPLLRRRRR
jgi:fibronectin-binding autotransporter adhesin